MSKKFTRIWLFITCWLTALTVSAQTDVIMQHNDLNRTGWNSTETKLNIKTVKPGPFGKLFTCAVDDQIYAQPLVKTSVNIPSVGSKNVVYVATTNNSVYAFDADTTRTSPYWKINLTPANARPPKNTDEVGGICGNGYMDFVGNFGIVGTPVIDPSTNTMYLVSRYVMTDGSGVFQQYLHALDITTGADKVAPMRITAQVTGTGDGAVNGIVHFDSVKQNQRPGLLLLNGIVYVGFASHCDAFPYHGWLLGYDAATLTQKIVYCTTPQGSEGGIWMSGSGPSADALGNIYICTGNGTPGLGSDQTNNINRGESLVKLTPSGSTLTVGSYFTPYNFSSLDNADLDFGVTEAMLIPNTSLIFVGCKDGNLFVADRNNMGGYNSTSNNTLQEINQGTSAHMHSSFAYYKGTTNELVYTWSENTLLTALAVNRTTNRLTTPGTTSGIQGPTGNSGAFMSTSSNGAVDSTGILWVSHSNGCDANQATCPGILRAIDANHIGTELWNSNMNPNDNLGNWAKFNCPTVANGKVYMATFSNQLVVYGLSNNGVDTCNSPNVALNKTAVASTSVNSSTPAMAFDGNTNTSWQSKFASANEWIYVDLGAQYNLCRFSILWGDSYAASFSIQVSNDAQTWNTVQTITGNLFVGTTPKENVVNLNVAARYVRMQGITASSPQFGDYTINEMSVYGTLVPNCGNVTGLNATNITANAATLGWTAVPGATSYSVQYKAVTAGSFTTVTSTTNSITLPALSCGSDYLYQVASVCPAGSGNYSASQPFSTSSCSSACGPIPTRWTSQDIGSVGLAGLSCYSGNTFTMQGSGAQIGGTSDGFQFAYQTLAADAYIDTRVVTQDATNAENMSGIMIRETLTPDSRYAFVGFTSADGAVFSYRNATGGQAVTTSSTGQTLGSSPTLPYWARLQKSGSLYTAYISPDGSNWTQLGIPVDVAFGAAGEETFYGLAVSSHNNTVLSTSTLDSYLETVPLPITLVSFTATNINDQYVSVKWTTDSEQNSSYFNVERAADTTQQFNTVKVINAAGNSSAPINYSTTDDNPLNGRSYYRLKEVDLDGNPTYSSIAAVDFGKNSAPQLFPNPAKTFFYVVAGVDAVKEIKVFDATGRAVLDKITDAGPSSTITVPCDNLTQGVYVVEINAGGKIYRQKLLKQ